MDKFIIIEHRQKGVYDIKIEQPGREDFKMRYIGYNRRDAIKNAREACGLAGRRLVTIKL